jgi:hypothetical protein
MASLFTQDHSILKTRPRRWALSFPPLLTGQIRPWHKSPQRSTGQPGHKQNQQKHLAAKEAQKHARKEKDAEVWYS